MTTFVKSTTTGYVIRYEGTGFNDPAFEAEEIPYADAGLSEAQYNALPNYDDVGQPWEPPKPLTRTEKVQNLLAAHDLSMDDLLDELEAVKARR